ncbi:DNA-binding protein, partial [Scytonema sp. NUACC26]|uniref:helix-turn-helix domain-containing transcriptional regulator n=1 Tax=Scytonema sp. NUACC26 TaxID=3140176 RepID=UPI0038B3E8B0
MPTSDSYFADLILRLKDPNYAALYLDTHFESEEGEAFEPRLIQLALTHVAKALGEEHMTPEQAKLHLEKLDELLSQPGAEAIYNLGNWLNALGLKLTVSVAPKV